MFDVKALLATSGLPAEMQASLTEHFTKNPDAVGKIETAMTAFTDSAIADAKKTLADSQAKIDAEWETLSAIRGGDADAIAKSEKRLEDLVTKNALLETRLRKVATDAGVDADAILKDLTVPEQKVAPKVDSTMTLDPKELLKQTGAQAWTALEQAAIIEDLAAEHLELFGKPMKDRTGLLSAWQEEVKKTRNTNLSLRDVWAKTHNVDARRTEMQAADVKRQTDEAYERGKREATDAAALRMTPTAPTEFQQSPVFEALRQEGAKASPVQVRGIPEGVQAAIAGFRKLRQAS